MSTKKSVMVSDMVSAFRLVFGAELFNAIFVALDKIGPNSERVTCGDVVAATERFDDDAMTRRVCLDKCMTLFPKLSVRRGRDGGIVHVDEPDAAPVAKAGKAVSAALAALEAAGVTLTPAVVSAAIAAAKEARKHAV